MNCSSCGAPGRAPICAYCGNSLMPDVPVEQEMEVLAEYHRTIATVPVEVRVQFLRNGFMPRGEVALIEAGIRCVPLLNAWSGDDGTHSPNDDAAKRLEGIVARLRIVGTSKEAKAAVEELEQSVATYRKRRVLIYVAVLMALAAVVLVGLIANAVMG